MATAGLFSLVFTAYAYFDDTEESTDNSFTVGTWALDVADGSEDGMKAGGSEATGSHFKGLEAGDSGTKSWAVTNTGSVAAYVDMRVVVAGSGTGHLADNVGARLYVSGSGGDIYSGPLSGAGGRYDLNLRLEAGEGKVIVMDWYVSDKYKPDENDEVSLSVNFSIQPAP